MFNQVIWEKGHSSMSAGVYGDFWVDSGIVTESSVLNDPDPGEGLETRKNIGNFEERLSRAVCKEKSASKEVLFFPSFFFFSAYLKFASI